MASPLEMIVHRSKRACPENYYSKDCAYDCCSNTNGGCGPSWYPVNYGPYYCEKVNCRPGYTACASARDHCCPITCSKTSTKCHGGVTPGYSSTYCCSPSRNLCCPFTKGGCCSAAEVQAAKLCGYLNQDCCPKAYGSSDLDCHVGQCSEKDNKCYNIG